MRSTRCHHLAALLRDDRLPPTPVGLRDAQGSWMFVFWGPSPR